MLPYFKQNINIFHNFVFKETCLTTLTTLPKHILSFCSNRYTCGQGDLNFSLTRADHSLTTLPNRNHFDNFSITGVEYI